MKQTFNISDLKIRTFWRLTKRDLEESFSVLKSNLEGTTPISKRIIRIIEIITQELKINIDDILDLNGLINAIDQKKASFVISWIIHEVKQILNQCWDNSEDMLELFNLSPLTYFVWDAKDWWKVKSVSSNVLKNLGYTQEEFLSWDIKFADIIHPDDLERIKTEVEKYTKEWILEYEQHYRVITKSWEIKYVYDKTVVKYDKNWEVSKLYWYIMDITEQKRLETQKSNYIEALNNSAIVQIIWVDWVIKFVNDLYKEVSWDDREIIWKSAKILWWKAYHDRDFWKEMWETILRWEIWRWVIENPLIWWNGWSYLTYTTITPSKDENWKITDFFAIKYDITEHIELQRDLIEILNSTSQWFWEIDEKLTIENVNDSFLALLWYKRDDVVWKTLYDFLDDENRAILDEQTWRITSSKDRSYKMELNKKNWNKLPVLIRATSIFDKNWKFRKAIAFISDISEIVEYEKKLEQLTKTDHLTWVWNKRRFDEIWEKQVSKIKNWKIRHLSFWIFDIDFFKKVNDTYWHEAWDIVLKEIWKILQNISDVNLKVFRLWWEEFWILWININSNEMYNLLERLRKRVALKSIDLWNKQYLKITLSWWVSEFQVWTHTDIWGLYKSADKLLYEAKNDWRNNIKQIKIITKTPEYM